MKSGSVSVQIYTVTLTVGSLFIACIVCVYRPSEPADLLAEWIDERVHHRLTVQPIKVENDGKSLHVIWKRNESRAFKLVWLVFIYLLVVVFAAGAVVIVLRVFFYD